MALELKLISGFELCRDGEPLTLPGMSQRLIALLGLHPRPVSRLYVAGTLWPDVTEARSLGNLRSALWRLGSREVIRASGDQLSLAPRVVVDARVIQAISLQLTTPSGPAEDEVLSWALQLLMSGGDLLPDWYDEWVLDERERQRELRLNALEVLGRRLLTAGDLMHARLAAMEVVRSEPLRESAQRLLMGVYLAEGNRAHAVQQFRSYRRLLHEELGVAPSPQMDALAETLGVLLLDA